MIYDESTDRYTQLDPIGLLGGGSKTYSYLEGNPVSYSDPLGLDRWGNTMCLPTHISTLFKARAMAKMVLPGVRQVRRRTIHLNRPTS